MPHVHFTFPEPLKKQLEKTVPSRERSQFVSRATEIALKLKEQHHISFQTRKGKMETKLVSMLAPA